MDKNFYITTPIYYPSAKPHMGHAYSSILADFFARLKKLTDYHDGPIATISYYIHSFLLKDYSVQ